MKDLPNEIVYHIVDLVDCLKTLWKLLTISRQMNAFALPSLYRELTFDSHSLTSTSSSSSPHIDALAKLARTAKSNKNLRFTKSFTVFRFISPLIEDENVDKILPFLPNLHHLSIRIPIIEPETLSLVPRHAQLTHLVIENTAYSPELEQLLMDHPTLKIIQMSGFWTADTPPLSPTALPMLHSLSCSLRVASKLGRPSVIHLKIDNFPMDNRSTPIPNELVREVAAVLPSVRVVDFTTPIHFPSAAALISLLPNVVRLKLRERSPLIDLDWQHLATSSLKTIILVVPAASTRSNEVAQKAFRDIENLEYLAVEAGIGSSMRYRRSLGGPIVQIIDHDWQPWERMMASGIF
ncbi:hypothetical protein PLEOSDRAFT_1103932 [Pleurotus ostreatus PC15]|uniref:F-box domain-containing protein n=1 Tax=Pleurotus ostreatus (strain PC15) TaxID=1137138 RepID=A0A067NUE9_PLEO1|nr:hypothetical protein PLEOSDRAFT_1103932 [Pleurotus ostreatus PC15]